MSGDVPAVGATALLHANLPLGDGFLLQLISDAQADGLGLFTVALNLSLHIGVAAVVGPVLLNAVAVEGSGGRAGTEDRPRENVESPAVRLGPMPPFDGSRRLPG